MPEREKTGHTDYELLLMSLRDPSVFARIVERYQEPFSRKALSLLGSEEDAEDVVQEAFVKMYLNAHQFEERTGASLSSWAYKILINTCYSHHQKHKRERLNVSYDDTLALQEEEIEQESNMERFLLTLSKIPESAARLLRSIVLEGASYRDLSAREGISDGALRVKVHRAKSLFKKALAQSTN